VATKPLWQFEQLPTTTTLAWNLAGFQFEKFLWHVVQLADVLTWLVFLPVALAPS
jgi:hypothetical protein